MPFFDKPTHQTVFSVSDIAQYTLNISLISNVSDQIALNKMIATQFEFMPKMLQGPAYNCRAVMPIGQEWSNRYGKQQIPFGIYSLVFGITTEVVGYIG
ncbi:hypothetical protein PRIPAC_79861 [Pristionchus pacificus]|uniref:Uncharacterized protein n=1 Tax=Pristionchus pacificus TaxID=54126 RepID=A0A2A6CJY2_PRIPA|nr:hypothetical protein PRIPAC_79861 [Pristionchus pacificus]|eukprot:PDM78353.1 hypothetical protein PRIPAC_30932 [Pristionchus pacificus]